LDWWPPSVSLAAALCATSNNPPRRRPLWCRQVIIQARAAVPSILVAVRDRRRQLLAARLRRIAAALNKAMTAFASEPEALTRVNSSSLALRAHVRRVLRIALDNAVTANQ
jgi:hypothetical protein